MSHTIEVSDDIYRALMQRAAREGKTLEMLIQEWATSITEQKPTTASTVLPDPRVDHPQYDPWAGFRNATTALTADSVDRHDAYLAQETVDGHESE